MKRILSVILMVAILLGSFSSCVVSAAEAWIIKGEFFSLVMTEFNYYPIDSTFEEMEASDNYDIEAKTMVDWGLLDEDEAFKGLESPIDKEIAVIICAKSVNNYLKSGNIDDIKDSKYLKHPELIANAVATGIISLDRHGYFNGKEKLTIDEASDLIEKTHNISDENDLVCGEEKFGYDFEDQTVLSPEDIENDESFSIIGYDEVCERLDAMELKEMSDTENEKPIISNMLYTQDNVDLIKTADKSLQFQVTMNYQNYQKYLAGKKKGEKLIYEGIPLNNNNPLSSIQMFIGIIVEIIPPFFNNGNATVILTREGLSDEEIAKHTELTIDSKKKNTNANLTITDKASESESGGFSFNFNIGSNGVSITARKTLSFSSNEYGNWRDSVSKPYVEASLNLYDFNVQSHNFKYLFRDDAPKDGKDPMLKFDYKTSSTFKLSFDGKLAPDDNRNGKFFNNITRSRWTSEGTKGSESIKVCSIPYVFFNTPVKGIIRVNLIVHFDGHVEFEIINTNSYSIIKKNGHITLEHSKEKQEKKDRQIHFKLGFELIVQVNVSFLKNVMSYAVSLNFEVKLSLQQFYQEKTVGTKGGGVCPTDIVIELAKIDKDYGFIIDGDFKITFSGEVKDIYKNKKSLIEIILNKIDKKIIDKMSFEFVIWKKGIHITSDNIAEKEKALNDNAAAKENNKFMVDKYAVFGVENAVRTVKVTGMPVKKETLQKKYYKGLQVKVKDEKICYAWYDKATDLIYIDTKKAGSTTIEIFAQKEKGKKEIYKQYISVSVNSNGLNNKKTQFSDSISDVRVYAI